MALDGIVKIVSESGSSNGTKVINADTGEEIQGVAGLTIDIRNNDVIRAKIDLCSIQVKIDAFPEYSVASPNTGHMKAVKRIEFMDGEVVEF